MKTRGKICLVILGAIFIWNIHVFFSKPAGRDIFEYKTGKRCGVVEENFTELMKHKSTISTDYYMRIKYDDAESAEIQKVSAKTWYNFKVGERICFATYEDRTIVGIGVFLTFLLLIFGIIISIAYALTWLTNTN